MRGFTVSRSFLVPCSLVALAGCSSPAAQSTGGGGGGTPFDAGAAVTSYQTGIGPIMLGPGVEETNCIVVRLGNVDGGYVRRFRADLDEGSHHMIVYTSSDTTESTTPTPCQPLSGILMGQHPVFIAQQATATLVFPSDENGVPVGFQLAQDQMLKIELHTINTTQAPLMVTGKAWLDTIPLSTKVTVSDLAFWGTAKFDIPASGSFDTGVLFQAALPGTKAFAVTTHQHHLGTEMQVWYSSAPGDTSNRVADSTSWSDPPLVMLDPPLDYPAGGTKGLSYDCHWVNPTATAVTFGESFNDEMCFLWQYYYPSRGFQECIDGNCATKM